MEFLQELHEQYSVLCSHIFLMDPFLNATKIYAMVCQEKKQQEIHSLSPSITAPEAAALSVNPGPSNTVNRANIIPNNDRDSCSNSLANRSNNNNQCSCDGMPNKPNLHCDLLQL
jgi:hypothetical protein